MPLSGQPIVVATALAYLAVVVGIGVWAGRRTRDASDFFIAGQRIGLLVTGLATMSAAFSGFVFVGGPGLTYRLGVTSFFISISVSLTSALLCWGVAKRLRLLAEVRELYTVPDAMLCRYRSRLASGLAAVAVVVGTLGYLGAQIQAMGVLVDSIFGLDAWLGEWSLPVSMALGLLVVLFYATAGGMLAGVYTDLFQGSLMVLAAAAVFYYAMASGGGISGIAASIAASEAFGPRFLDPFGNAPALTAIGFFFVFSVGTLGQPHMLHKFYMLDDPRKLKWMPAILGGSQLVCSLIWIGVGLAVPALVANGRLPPLESPDAASTAFLLGFVPPLLAGVVFAGILAAIMSTADSFVNIASAALVRDLPRALGWRVERELLLGRLATPAIAVAAGAFAWLYGDLIALLGTFAFGTFGAALGPALVVGLNWRGVTARAACASIATGLFGNLGLEFLARQPFFPGLPRLGWLAPGVLPTAVSLAGSFAVLFAVSLWDRRRGEPELPEDVAAVLEM